MTYKPSTNHVDTSRAHTLAVAVEARAKGLATALAGEDVLLVGDEAPHPDDLSRRMTASILVGVSATVTFAREAYTLTAMMDAPTWLADVRRDESTMREVAALADRLIYALARTTSMVPEVAEGCDICGALIAQTDEFDDGRYCDACGSSMAALLTALGRN